ncbi:L-type lectin-domain containing receptor kinase ix.1 [Phtheirospermum japonicum]|uniref:non-specific serine/threonine protein kinase n=1 Tax=Phtheirospermum japonicum TaxID=374723 RepID=A0A830BT69_9LAMI|nr:L-type lectin-domain containing receptor kinase ix.1 [Phtheirospermum japonicum]
MSARNNSILSVFILISLITPSSISLSFNIPTIDQQHQGNPIVVSGNAYITSEGIQVTTNDRNQAQGDRAGRATYIDPLHLWDRASRNLTDFTTRFSFVIDSGGSNNYGDGLAFFLAPNGSSIQPWSYGGSLGIGNSSGTLNSSQYSFVAVEFDTYRNSLFDPVSYAPHIGINVNSMRSLNTTTWRNNITLGRLNNATISYSATSMLLRVDVTGFSGNRTWIDSISHVVDLRNFLPEYVSFGFSAATGASFESHNVKSWDFNSSLEINITPEEPENKTGLIVGLSVGLSVVIFGVALASYCLRRRKKFKKGSRYDEEEEEPVDPDMDMEFEKGSGAKRFSYSELVLATKDFAEEEKLGEGGFGGVYRGFLRETDSYIAVKRVSRGSKQGLKEYVSEVKIISQLRHRNLVQLIGWCHQRGELLLVYEFMPNGSLDSHLFKSKSILDWEVRYKIAQGLASGLLYLHEEWERCVVHRDIKSSNIMLDSSFNAKLGDFGLARLVDHEKGSQTTVLAGTMGYMAPECVITGRASKETDVYSFGVVLLEIACGRRPIEHRYRENKNQVVLVEWVWSLYGMGKLLEAADPNLSTGFDEREMEQLMIVGLWCVHPDCNHRPSIRQAIHVLKFEAPVPILPPALPVPTYFGPTMSVVLSSTDTYSGGVSDSKYSNYSSSSNVTSSSESNSTALLRAS